MLQTFVGLAVVYVVGIVVVHFEDPTDSDVVVYFCWLVSSLTVIELVFWVRVVGRVWYSVVDVVTGTAIVLR